MTITISADAKWILGAFGAGFGLLLTVLLGAFGWGYSNLRDEIGKVSEKLDPLQTAVRTLQVQVAVAHPSLPFARVSSLDPSRLLELLEELEELDEEQGSGGDNPDPAAGRE